MSDAGVNIGGTGDPTVDAILAGSGGGLPVQDAIGGIWAGPNSNLGGAGQNAPLGGRRSASEATPGVNAPYTADYVTSLWRNMPLEDRVRLQDTLVGLGLASSVIPGEFDDGTLRGIERLLSLSNREGSTWQDTVGRLRSLESQGLLDTAQEQYEPAPRLVPDYATLAQDVKTTFRQRLGREPDDYELQQLTGELTGFYADEHEAQEEYRRLQHEAATTPGIQPAATVGSVDPVSRFYERFDELLRGETATIEAQEAAVTQRDAVDSAVNVASRAARGEF